MKTHPFALLAAISCCLAFAGCQGCGKSGRAVPPPDKAVFGEMAPRDAVDFAPYFAHARALVTHAPAGAAKPVAAPAALPGQRVMLTAWWKAHTPFAASATGASLDDAVTAAATTIAGASPPADARLEIDVVTGAEGVDFGGEVREPLYELGLHGYVAVKDPAHVGWVSPSEMIAFRYFDLESIHKGTAPLARDRLIDVLTRRAGVEKNAFDSMNVYRVTTTSRVESATPSDGRVVPLMRSMPLRPAKVTPTELTDAVRAGADYLCRVLDDRGRFEYQYNVVEDKSDRAYSILRHAGSTYAILEAYGETPNPLYLQKATQAIHYMESRVTRTSDGTYLQDNLNEEQQKSGGTGLMLVALAKYTELTGGDPQLQEEMRDLARYIVHQQYPDGHFRSNEDVKKEDESAAGKDLVKEVTYYPGEAVLGLVRLYQIDPQQKWLDAAKKGADFLIKVRDVNDDLDHQIHDHWLSYALDDLYRLTKDQAYVDHAFKIARSIVKKEGKPDTVKAPDYVATFYDQGETTPTSTRLEALAADLELSRYLGKDTGWIEPTAMDLAVFMRAQQYVPDNEYFVARPEKALGGVRESLLVNDVRIDYVQHAMSAWLHYARFLRDPNWGKGKQER